MNIGKAPRNAKEILCGVSIATVIFILVSGPVFSALEIPGGDLVHVEGTEAKYTVCRRTKGWEIIDAPNPLGNAGGDGISVFKSQNSGPICDPNRTPVLKTIGYFMAMSGPLMILDTGTGPDIRDIHIYDLSKSTEVYRSSYTSNAEARIENRRLIHWTNRDELAKSMGCKSVGGQSVGVNVEISVDLKTLTVVETGRKECALRSQASVRHSNRALLKSIDLASTFDRIKPTRSGNCGACCDREVLRGISLGGNK